jgi:hypothetical protein
MSTIKHMGRNQLVDRLTAQLASQKNPVKDPAGAARAILQKRGQMDDNGELTAKGKKRDGMTAGERAIDRASKKTGLPKSKFGFHPQTNTAFKRG